MCVFVLVCAGLCVCVWVHVCVLEGKLAAWASLLVCGLRAGGCNGVCVCVAVHVGVCASLIRGKSKESEEDFRLWVVEMKYSSD